jgi:hypothetical protein
MSGLVTNQTITDNSLYEWPLAFPVIRNRHRPRSLIRAFVLWEKES